MRLWNFLTNHWRLIYFIGLAVFIFFGLMMMAGEPSTEADTIIYIPILFREMRLQFILFPAILLVFGAAIYIRERHDLYAGALMIITPILLSLVIGQPAIGDTRLGHIESVHVGKYNYNLAGYDFAHIVLYECDSLSIICHAIYRGDEVLLSPHYPEPCHGQTDLMVDNQKVWLVNDCEIVITHQPPG